MYKIPYFFLLANTCYLKIKFSSSARQTSINQKFENNGLLIKLLVYLYYSVVAFVFNCNVDNYMYSVHRSKSPLSFLTLFILANEGGTCGRTTVSPLVDAIVGRIFYSDKRSRLNQHIRIVRSL